MSLLSENNHPTKAHYKILAMSWAGWLFDFYDLILYSFLLTAIAAELRLSDMQSSLILGTSLAATAAGGILFGLVADKFGRKKTLQLTILTYSVGTFMCAFSMNIEWLLFWRIVTGLGVGGEWATGQTYIAETFPPKMRGRFGAFMQTGAPLGIALAAVVGSFFAPQFGWRTAFLLSVIPAALVLFIRRELPESDLWLQRKEVEAHSLKNSASKIAELFSPSLRKLFLVALVLTTFDMCAYWFTYSWLPSYLHKTRGLTVAASGLWMLVTQSGGFLGYLSFGFVADKLGRRPAYSIYSVVMAGALLMVTLFWEAISGSHHMILPFMFLVGFGTGMFGGYGPLFAEIFPTHIRSTAMGTAFNVARGVQFFTPIAITVIAARAGLSGGIAIAAIFAILTGLWVWMLPETKGKELCAD